MSELAMLLGGPLGLLAGVVTLKVWHSYELGRRTRRAAIAINASVVIAVLLLVGYIGWVGYQRSQDDATYVVIWSDSEGGR